MTSTAVTIQLPPPKANTVQSAKAIAVTNCTATNHAVQPFLMSTMVPVIKLKIPINAKCGAKLEKGSNANKNVPDIK